MQFHELIDKLEGLDILVWLDNEQLKVSDPNQNATPELINELKHFKPDLLEWLKHESTLTKSDFPLCSLTSNEFDECLSSIDENNVEDVYTATHMQVGMLISSIDDDQRSLYTAQFSCRLTGELNIELLQQSLQQIINKYDVLRTAFFGFEHGKIQQLVSKNAKLPFVELDYSDKSDYQSQLKAYCKTDLENPFILSNSPLMRVTLIKLKDNRHQFILTHHHALLDGWCKPKLFSEILANYEQLQRGLPVTSPRIEPYRSYIQWLTSQDTKEASVFWKSYLSSVNNKTELEFINHYDLNAKKYEYVTERYSLPPSLGEKLSIMCNSHKFTLGTVFQVAWGYLLHRFSDEDIVTFGTAVSGRPAELNGVEDMMGLFINTIPAAMDFTQSISVIEFIKQAFKQNAQKDEFSYLALSEIHKLSNVPRDMALFDTLLNFENYPIDIGSESENNGQAITCDQVELDHESGIPLTCKVFHRFGKLWLELSYQAQKIQSDDITRVFNAFEQILINFASHPDKGISEIDVLSKNEENQLINQWGKNCKEYEDAKTFLDLFSQQVELKPSAIAVKYRSEELSYAELDKRSNQLANYLNRLNVNQLDNVIVCVERAIDTMIILLGVMKSGAAYVPVDPELPIDRISHIIQDSNAKVIVTQEHLSDLFTEQDLPLIPLADNHEDNFFTTISDELQTCNTTIDSNAYVIYTSGSTGAPKGVVIRHKNLVNFLRFAVEEFWSPKLSGSVVSSTICFDATVQSLYVPLVVGGYVELLEDGIEAIEQLSNRLLSSKQNLLFKITPSHLRALNECCNDDHSSSSEHMIVVAGEALSKRLISPWAQEYLPKSTFINEYGPTEATVGSSIFKISGDWLENSESSSVPIGKPWANFAFRILDQQLRPCPINVPGELYVSGAGLSQGYLNLPELTAEKFLDLEVSESTTERFYRTGDLVKWLDSGDVEFIARTDEQIKVNGYRVQKEEIIKYLVGTPAVQEAVVAVKLDNSGRNQLVAYLTLTLSNMDLLDDMALEFIHSDVLDECRRSVESKLPHYMHPYHYVILEQIPVNPNGKIEWKALPEPIGDVSSLKQFVAPRNETEEKMCQLWESVLNVDQVGIEDSFFHLGGDSIIAIQLATKAKKLGLSFSVGDLLEHPTINSLCQQRKAVIKEEIKAVAGEQFLLPIQQAFQEQEWESPNHYNLSVILTAPKEMSEEHLFAITQAIFEKHDILRLEFNLPSHAYYKSIDDATISKASVYQHFTDNLEEELKKNIECFFDEVQQSFDLNQLPLFKIALATSEQDHSYIMLCAHHIVMDTVSLRILVDDIETAWRLLTENKAVNLGRNSCSFQQWGNVVKAYAQQNLDSVKAYWLEKLKQRIAPLPEVVEENKEGALVKFSLDEKVSKSLLGSCNEAYKTRINELLLSAILVGYQKWTGSETISIGMESHGRDPEFKDIDLSETVGWFTFIYPLILSAPYSSNISEVLKAVKEQVRSLPDSGISYGVLKYINEDKDIRYSDVSHSAPTIKFNYLGQLGTNKEDRRAFQMAKGIRSSQVSPNNKDLTDIKISAEVVEGRLSVLFKSNKNFKNFSNFSQNTELALNNIFDHCDTIIKNEQVLKGIQITSIDNNVLAQEGIEV